MACQQRAHLCQAQPGPPLGTGDGDESLRLEPAGLLATSDQVAHLVARLTSLPGELREPHAVPAQRCQRLQNPLLGLPNRAFDVQPKPRKPLDPLRSDPDRLSARRQRGKPQAEGLRPRGRGQVDDVGLGLLHVRGHDPTYGLEEGSDPAGPDRLALAGQAKRLHEVGDETLLAGRPQDHHLACPQILDGTGHGLCLPRTDADDVDVRHAWKVPCRPQEGC